MEYDTQKQIEALALMLHNDIRKTDIRFKAPLEVTSILKFYGVATDNELRVWILKHDGNWYELIYNQLLAGNIAQALTDRLKLLSIMSSVLVAKHDQALNITIVESAN